MRSYFRFSLYENDCDENEELAAVIRRLIKFINYRRMNSILTFMFWCSREHITSDKFRMIWKGMLAGLLPNVDSVLYSAGLIAINVHCFLAYRIWAALTLQSTQSVLQLLPTLLTIIFVNKSLCLHYFSSQWHWLASGLSWLFAWQTLCSCRSVSSTMPERLVDTSLNWRTDTET